MNQKKFNHLQGDHADERINALFGIVALLVAYIAIGVSIALSPWFSWQRNALSDLGHSIRSKVAPIFNFGLLLAGLIIMFYTAMTLRKYAKYTSICVATSAFLLQLVATFDEVYGFFHYVVSVLFFVSIGIASIVYAMERKSVLAVMAFIIGLSSWILYELNIYNSGIAVPETISSLAIAAVLVSSALKIYLSK